MIELSHVYKTYPGAVHALKNVNLNIDKGEFVFLTGPSGAGKTTLFKILSGFDLVTSGTVDVCGFDLSTIKAKEVSAFRRKIGVVFQDFKLLKDRTVFENVAMPLLIRNEKKDYVKDRVDEILAAVGLTDKANQLPEFISGGEQQRTAIARGIIHKPGVLIADEPTGNLDPKLSEEIMDLLERVSKMGTTVFVATHDHEMVKRRGHRVVSIQSGILQEVQL